MINKLRELFAALLSNYPTGLSNTSTNKFEDIKNLFHEEFDIPLDSIYATGAGTRPGNLEVRLSQGVQATKHSVLGLAFLVDDKGSEKNRKRLTNSTFTTVSKFLGRGKANYDNILVLIQSEGTLFATGLIATLESDLSAKLSDKLKLDNVIYLSEKDTSPVQGGLQISALFNQLEKGYNKIYFGAPGTGKSHNVKSILSTVPDNMKERVTFHPEFDNVSFIGGYKPISEANSEGKEEIKYKFVPQVFTNIYVNAWNDLNNNYYLAIEEINRGNCAEIFGDIFQLLDRDSDYTISPSTELKVFLEQKLRDKGLEGIKGGKMKLPPNLILLATMNTSDQSLYPMDSAFKRRWKWEYVPINYQEKNLDGSPNISYYYFIDIGEGITFKWIEFIEKVNYLIKSNPNLGMDKCIGNYFIKANQNKISVEDFIYKVVFYLWNDVFKDEENEVFPEGVTYEDFFPISSNGGQKLKEILHNIGIVLPSLVQDESIS